MTIDYTSVTPGPVPDDATTYDVRMRDGIRLATDHYSVAQNTVLAPTILIRLPYDKNGEYTFIADIARYMVQRGYHVVAQDVRGKFRSEGESLLFVNEVYDGYDTIEWITQQPWSDGTVAMWGDSYYGYTQWAAVSSRHPALKAIAPRVTGTGLGELPVAAPGANTSDVEMSIILMYPLTHFHSADTYEWEPDWSTRPYIDDLESFQRQVGARSPSFDLWYPQPVVLRRFPNGSPFDAPAVPVLNTIGWWDNCAPWSWRDHAEIQKRPAWAHNEYLMIESIDHENNRFELPLDNSPQQRAEMLPRYLDPALEFFDVFVRGLAPASSIPKVRWNLANTAGIRESASWPPPNTKILDLYLDADSLLSSVPDSLARTADWVHDPDNLVPSTAENPFAFLEELPDERALAARADVLVFTSPIRDAALYLVGAVSLEANVSSTGPATDVFARLYDLSSDGKQTRIARGQVRILDTTDSTPISIDMGQLGYALDVGHALRLHVCSSDFPEFIPQPGTDESPWTATTVATTTQSLELGGARGARLIVHTVDAADLPPTTSTKAQQK
ncbi:CocE/NonD family hydrolase [Rhodococcus sp. IEGM1428]|uniref:CocE/NonD family hydrolase n=1 Tax=Rhodococcus sp. IEGM1428 TaxID=3392191 RepID=UPI003D0DBF46